VIASTAKGAWQEPVEPGGKCGGDPVGKVTVDPAGERDMKVEILEDMGIAPVQHLAILPGAEACGAAARDLLCGQGRAESVERAQDVGGQGD